MVALSGAGSDVTWSGDLSPLMIDAQPIAAPSGGTRVSIAAPRGSSVVLSDDIGVIDTVRPESVGAGVALGSATGRIAGRVNGSVASTVNPDPISLHKVLVIGSAGWESKFVVVALEEEGWKVDALIRLAPDINVRQGSASMIDTSRYTAVVALDSAASPYANRIIEFVRSGGGAVLEPPAASLEAMSSLRAGAARSSSSLSVADQTAASVSLATLAIDPITSLRSDAVPMESRRGAVAIAARRVGAGRAIQLGYQDTWRWRMTGGDGGVRDHRRWWTGVVSRVAYAPRVPSASLAASTAAAITEDRAPIADLVSSIGPATPASKSSVLSGKRSDWATLLLMLFALSLIAEVASRRLRGAS